MCDRYVLAATPTQLAERFALAEAPPGLPMGEVTPQAYLPVVVGTNPSRLDIMRWGLVPTWAQDERAGARNHTAAAETVAKHPAYRTALRYHRCLVPASGFSVRQTAPRLRPPRAIYLPGAPLIAFAGLYAIWCSPDGSEVRTFTILTCAANALLAPIHPRMPVILTREAEVAWLDPRETRTNAVLPLLQPYPVELMAAGPIPDTRSQHRDDGPAS